MSVSDKVINKIKQENIRPKPSYIFLLKNLFLWLLGFFSVILGAISFSLIIYLFKSQDDLLFNNFGASLSDILLGLIPVIWLIFLITFSFLFYFNFKKTKRAYKYNPLHIFALGLLLSFIVGTSFYLLGFSRRIDNYLANRVNSDIYTNYLNPQMNFWSQPSKGRLSGQIIEVRPNSLLLIDSSNENWELIYDENLINRHSLTFTPGLAIKAFGEIQERQVFYVREILTWRGNLHSGQKRKK